ncbi:tetratricopeptide repeat protein [Streptomyces europaeiscabiei]|uniref:tetratricopeptide repeat protein n=1 Tax=Streptomyces europaeiscabiei TaxID=146819 RepID=UPI0029A0F84D|nr:tetratricopeptide repeat protein [Streptomyces europaeiscabiei]MDX3611302.1 NB-ARC domain-containing protein [Streptomyces europaeiscabiei]
MADIRAGTSHEVAKAGSGYRISHTLVLVADHTVSDEDGEPLDRIEVRLGHPAQQVPVRLRARRVWVARNGLDVALLKIEPGPDDPPIPPCDGLPVSWGRLVGNHRVTYTGLGFPSFAAFGQDHRVVEQLSGGLNPLSVGPDGILVIDQDAYPGPNRQRTEGPRWWAGLSGAAVFAIGSENLLLGVVVEDDDLFGNRRLRLRLASSFCEDDDFALLLLGDGQVVPLARPVLPGGAEGGTATVPVPRQLPADIPHQFVGRHAELDLLSGLLGTAAADAAIVTISAVSGTAGIGKSTLAIRWSYLSNEKFPDGQLYANLRGFDPTGEPLAPETAIRGFLDALGVSPDRMPSDTGAQAALYRTLLSGKRILLVLDNARNADQVRPLLPGSPTCKVLITSRDNLMGLVPMGARLIALDVLSDEHATALLARAIGSHRTDAEPESVAEVIEYCGRLPLALAVVAARAAERPGFALSLLADELRDTRARLDALETGDPSTSPRTVFSWSYGVLSDQAARMFRLLALAPGLDASVQAAACVAGCDLGAARIALNELTRAHMMDEVTPGRFVFHDLLRAYAVEKAEQDTIPQERAAAQGRLLDFYLHTSFRAERRLYPQRDAITLEPAAAGVGPLDFDDYSQAMNWFRQEHGNLRDTLQLAADLGRDGHVWQLAWCMSTFLDRQVRWSDYADTQRAALQAARRLGDSGVQALTHRLLATAHTFLGEHPVADQHLEAALVLFVAGDDVTGQARTHFNIAMSHEKQDRFTEAAENAAQSITMYRSVGHDMGAARVLSWLGWYQALDGQFEEALISSQQALTALRELGNRWEEAHAYHHIGYAHLHLGRPETATEYYELGASLFADLNDPYHRSRVLTDLGDAHLASANDSAAALAWHRAAKILADLGHPDLESVTARLRRMNAAVGQVRS